MNDPLAPINIFNDRVFAECYGWGKNQILAFLEHVASHPGTYGINNEQSRQDVQLLQQKIAGLTDIDDPRSICHNPPPSQQVLRTENATGKLSLDPTRTIRWDANNTQEPFYIIFDLLGCFLSLITSVPAAGTDPIAMAKKYFLPVLVLYAKWCFEFKISISKTPMSIQVTWFETNNKLWPFFGASIAGYSGPQDAVAAKAWEEAVRNTRWDYLHNGGMLPAGYTTFSDSPKIRTDSAAGTKYGNCCETYPYLYILRDPHVNSSYGISVAMAGLFPRKDRDPLYTTYNGHAYWGQGRVMWPPCDNCQSLLAKAGADLDHYRLYNH